MASGHAKTGSAKEVIPQADAKSLQTKNGMFDGQSVVADPNWIRGFYDEYDPHADFRGQHAGPYEHDGHYSENQVYYGHNVPLVEDHYIGHHHEQHHEPRHMHFSVLEPHIHETLRDYHEPGYHKYAEHGHYDHAHGEDYGHHETYLPGNHYYDADAGLGDYLDLETKYHLPGGHSHHGYVAAEPYYASASSSDDSGPDHDHYYVP